MKADLATFPRLLLEHAHVRGERPATREKDLGIWQTWSWAQVADEVRSLACGLAALGFKRGMVIIGGLGSILGSFLGAAFIVLTPIVLNILVHTFAGSVPTSVTSNLEPMVFGGMRRDFALAI